MDDVVTSDQTAVENARLDTGGADTDQADTDQAGGPAPEMAAPVVAPKTEPVTEPTPRPNSGLNPGANSGLNSGLNSGPNSGPNSSPAAGAGDTSLDGGGQPNFVAFRISGQDYCVDILAVREISLRTHVTPLPQSPPFISGVINLRGSVVPVLDCQVRFGLKPDSTRTRQVIIVVRIGERTLGLLVDEVTEILNIPHDAIKDIPDAEETTTTQLISGILVSGDRIIRLVDLDQVVPEKERAAA